MHAIHNTNTGSTKKRPTKGQNRASDLEDLRENTVFYILGFDNFDSHTDHYSLRQKNIGLVTFKIFFIHKNQTLQETKKYSLVLYIYLSASMVIKLLLNKCDCHSQGFF